MKTVYWSPFHAHEQYPLVQLIYEEPDPLLKDLLPRRNKESNGDNWFQCHAFQASIKNTFVLRVPFDVEFGIDSELGLFEMGRNKENWEHVEVKQPSVIDALTVAIRGNWIFWSEEPMIMTTMPAHYHFPVFGGHYVGGSMDIGKWFRPVEGAIQLNNGVNAVSLLRGDPLAYVKFESDEPVELKRFYLTEELEKLSRGCITYKKFEPKRALPYLYEKFTNRGLDKVVTQQIKKNVMIML